jgi:hypothetical protein
MSSIDNNLGGGGGSASASGKKGAIQLSDGNFNLTSNKELKSDPKTGTITTTGLTTTGTIWASTISTSNLVADTVENLTVVGNAYVTGDATVDGTISTTKVDISGTLTSAWVTVSGTLTATSITGTSANIAGEIKAGTLSSTGNGYFSSNVGVGTTDTAEYKFLVNDGTSNLFGVPLSSANLTTGKTIVYDGSGWVYDNAGPADGTQSGEILAWDGSEWSANSAVVIEGTNVGIGTVQPTQKLDVAGNVRATYFIGSGDTLANLNASNIISGTLDNARLPQTISVSNLEATANLVVGGPADITGTLSAAGLTSSENVTVTGNNTLSASNLRTSNLFVTGPTDITGTLSASTITGSGDGLNNLNASNIISGTLDNARLPQTISVSNLEATANLVVNGPADITGTLSAAGLTSSENVTVTGNNTLSASNLRTSNLFVTGPTDITGTLSVAGLTSSENVTVTGNNTLSASNIETSNLTVTNSQNVLGNLFVSHTVSAPTLLVGNDARVTGNLTVSGGVVSITTTTTGTSNIVITNAGTGPVLVATQLGDQPIANFVDGRTGSNVSALFISGGEQGPGRDGYVGLGTTLPTHQLDVRGDANVATNLDVHGTLSTSNLLSTYRVQGATLSSTGQIQASGTITTSDSFLHYGGATTPSPYMNSNVPGLSTNTYVYTRAIVNQDQVGNGPAAIVFGNSNTFGSNQISLVTRGENRLYIDSSDIVNFPGIVRFPEATSNAYMNLLPRAGGNGNNAIEIYQEGETPVRTARIQYNGDADFRTITVSNIQGGSPLTISASGGTINVQSDMIMVGSTLTADAITGNSPLTLSAGSGDTINVASDMIMVDNSIITAGTIYYTTLTTEAGVSANISAFDVTASNSLVSSGNAYITSNLGVGTTDTAEYKFLVKNGTSNLFGVPYDTANLTDGKTIVYNGSDWVYDNAGPADGTQTGEILTWNGSEWSANSAVVVEGSNVGIGSTQPREILDVAGNVRITQSVLINETFQGRAMRLNDTPASNLHYQPNFTITGSLTSAGDIKTNQAFRGHNMFLSNVLTISGGVVTNTGTVNTTINGSLTVQGDAVVNSNISAVSVNTGDVISNRAVHGKAIRLGNTPESNVYYNPNLTVSGSLTAGGDVKSGTTFRGPDMVLSGTASIGTLTTSNITHGSELTVTTNLLMGPGTTLTASNIVGASPVTISSNLVMASGYTLTAGAIEPPAGGGTLTTSNLVGSSFLTVTANTNVVAEFTASEKLIKYPTVKMTSATVSGFVASASSEYSSSWAAWKAFGLKDYSVSSGDSNVWASGNGTYDGNGAYASNLTTTATDGSEYAGEWLQIQLPTSIKLQYSQLFPRPGYTSEMPKNGTILGGTNTTSWNSISSWENASYVTGEYTIHNALTENYYDYYRLVVEDISGTLVGVTEIADWELYGYPENDLGDGTDVIFKTVPNTPKTDFLDVYYDAKEYESGNITDESGNGVTGTIGSSVSYTSTEPKAWNFDGTVNGTVSASLTTPGGDWPHTHAIWFKADSITTTQTTNTIGWFGTATPRQRSIIKISPTYIGFDFDSDSQDATLNVQTGIWYHAVFVYPGGGVNNAKIYVNGFDAGATGGSTNAISLPTSTTLYLANQTNSFNPYFNGSIANYRLYDRPLSADEVWELYGYQKAYFSVSPDVVTYKAGRVGIGTSEPRAVLDVVGDASISGGLKLPHMRVYRTADTGIAHSGALRLDSIREDNFNGWDTTTYEYTVPMDGVYNICGSVLVTSGSARFIIYINDASKVWLFICAASEGYAAGSVSMRLNKGDRVNIRANASCTIYYGVSGYDTTWMSMTHTGIM